MQVLKKYYGGEASLPCATLLLLIPCLSPSLTLLSYPYYRAISLTSYYRGPEERCMLPKRVRAEPGCHYSFWCILS